MTAVARWHRPSDVALAFVVVLLCGPAPAEGGIPCLVDAAGMPLRGGPMPIVYHPDPGPLVTSAEGPIGRDEGAELLRAAAAAWEGVPTADVRFVAGAAIPVDVGPGNYGDFLGRCGDGMSPIIFDPTGEIIDAVMGVGAAEVVLGFTVHDCGTETAPGIPEATIVVNGSAVQDLDAAGARRVLRGILVHELGHVLNLCHSHLNAELADDGNPDNDVYLPVMFPFHSDDGAEIAPAPRFDDAAMVSMLYPAPDFYGSAGTIAGHVLAASASRPVSGAVVTVRSVREPLAGAAWTTSGWLRLEATNGVLVESSDVIPAIDGSYQVSGLPAGSYTVEVDGGVGGAPTEFYSGAAEGSDPRRDPPGLAEPVDVAAGEMSVGVTVELDRRLDSALGETEWDVAWRGRATIAGVNVAVDTDELPAGVIEFLSTGRYRVTPATELSGAWQPSSRRTFRHQLPVGAMQALLDPNGGVLHIASVHGQGRASRRYSRIRGRIVTRGVFVFPRSRFKLRLSYTGTRRRGVRSPGRVPIVGPPSSASP
jgi:hypothetical protein